MTENRSEDWDEKQVFIDTMANYLLDIDFNDAFRYTLSVNDNDRNSLATVYHFESQWIKCEPFNQGKWAEPKCINIIDVSDIEQTQQLIREQDIY